MGGRGPATDGSTWDANAAMSSASSASDYQAICAGRKDGPADQRSSWALPHHKRPGAAANTAGVRAARSRFGQTEGLVNREAARTHVFEAHSLPSEEAEATSGITFVDQEEVAASFRADVEKRTITGLLVPWGKVARAGFAKWRFARGSLHWVAEQRVKLNLGHERKETVGVAVRLQDTMAGLTGTFRIARGDEGDRALSLAEDGVLDGFSVEVDFDDGDGWEPDPSDESIRLVGRAALKGAALTGYPAFDDARVDRIAAARREGVKMGEENKEEVTLSEEEGAVKFQGYLESLANKITDSHTKLTEDLAQSVGESISAGVKVALEEMAAPGQGPQPVRAARYAVTREAPVYTFDGRGESLVKDAWYAATAKDDDAVERLRKYRRQTEEVSTLFMERFRFALEFAPQTTTTASEVIPPGYRPELYVAELQKGRPLVALASRGSIANATPFTVPVFTSSTSVTADHTEGTNPSDGSLDFDVKTVTPQAVSGRLVLSREIVDSSNPAIDQIALATMRESYARQTEAKVYTLLNGTSGAGGTITTDNVPSGAMASTVVAAATDDGAQALLKHVRERLAKYPFQRFASPNGGAMGQNATTRLATANDDVGRPLLPSLGMQNTLGSGNALTQGWNVDGLPLIPAWAMTGTAAGDSQILFLNSADLWVWESPLLTFRFEEKQGPANIELNVFGYFGTHLLRPVGLSGIRITLT